MIAAMHLTNAERELVHNAIDIMHIMYDDIWRYMRRVDAAEAAA